MKFHRSNQGVTGVSSRFGNIIGQQHGALAMMAVSWRLVIRDGYLGEGNLYDATATGATTIPCAATSSSICWTIIYTYTNDYLFIICIF